MTIAEQIIAILEDDITEQVHFRCEDVSVWGGGYKIIARKIRDGDIMCMENVRLDDDVAMYTHTQNKFSVSTAMAQARVWHLIQKAMIVHEATHALEDRQRKPLNTIDAECPSYIAQCMYLKIAVPNRFLIPMSSPILNLFVVANNIAAQMVRPGGNRTLDSSSPDLAALKQEIRQIDVYRRTQHDLNQYDGIASP